MEARLQQGPKRAGHEAHRALSGRRDDFREAEERGGAKDAEGAVVEVLRVLDRFWLLSAERAVGASGHRASPRVLELTARAALAREAAARTLRPAEPFGEPGAAAPACELYREAVHWALLAHVESASGATTDAAGKASVVSAPNGATSLLERVDHALLVRAAGGEAELAALLPRLGETYREFAELSASEQKKLAERLEAFAQKLVEPLSGVVEQLERIWIRRVVRIGVVLAVLLGLAYAAHRYSLWSDRKNDLAVHATWTASSNYPAGGCQSPKQSCPGGENYFFHTTQENDPWIVFDLGKERRVSGVEIDNRLDCCPERSKPLAIAVSTDKRHWTEVARSDEEFTTLHKSFSRTKARYVKIHLPRPDGILHLSRVRIFP